MTRSRSYWLVGSLLAVVLIAGVAWKARSYLALGGTPTLSSTTIPVVSSLEPSTNPSPSSPNDLKLTVVAEGLIVPWDIAFTASNRILVTEREGTIRAIVDGKLLDIPLISFPEVDSKGEEGLMGMTLDPDYATNNYVYVCYAYPKNGELTDKVVRLVDQKTQLTVDATIIDNIPSAQFHAGCSVRFGPDGKLYISTGDARTKEDAQKLDSLAGKILRINADGSTPTDNPYPNSPVWSYGHRNPQGIAWHPVTQQLWGSEHGPSVIDGPAGGDEINLIQPAKNYGWPVVSHEKSQTGMIDPILVFTPAIAPGSAHFYASDVIPEFQNNLLIGLLKGEGILSVSMAAPDFTQIDSYKKIPGVDVGRVRAVTTGPDGAIYFSTSNRDGRGSTRDGDDKIYRLEM